MEIKLWDVGAAAAFLGMSKQWVYKESASGVLPSVKVGSKLRFVPSKLQEWVASKVRPGK